MVLLTLIGLVASIALSASVVPLASAASATATATDEWPAIPLTGTFVGLSPARLLDTRPGASTVDGQGSDSGVIGGGRTLVVPVVGRPGIAAGAVAVVVNLTEASATASSYLTLYPAGSSRPGTSNLNVTANHVTSVEATVPLDSSGGIAVYNRAGNVNAVIDVVGYYAGATDTYASSVYHPQSPTRLVDTRHSSALASGHFLPLDLPSLPNATAVALNVTVVGPTRAGFLAVWSGTAHRTTHTSALNFTAGQTVANMAITTTVPDPVNGDSSFSVGNFSAGSVNVIVDVIGFYRQLYDGPGTVFKAITPTRVVDTRIGKGLPHALGAGQSLAAATSAVFGDADTVGMVANATGLGDPSGTYLSVFPAGSRVPGTSSLNLAPRETASNMVMAGLSPTSTRSFAEYNRAGTLGTLVDVVGYFEKTANRRSVTTLRSSSTSTTYDTELALTASVAGNWVTPTGTVTFSDATNGSILGVEPLSGGVAHMSTAALAPGTRKIVASYNGPALTSPSFEDAFAPSASTALPIAVAPPRTTVATAFQNDPRHDGMDTGDTFDPATLHQSWSINFNPPTGTADLTYPLIAGGRVFITAMDLSDNNSQCASGVFALDATTGSVDWQTLQSASPCSRLLLTYDGGQLFVQDSSGTLTAYNASSGAINWTATAPPGHGSFASAPTAYDGALYTQADGTFFALGETNGAILWSHAVNGNVGSPAVDDSGVYGDVDPWCSASSGFDLDGTIRWNVLETGCSSGFEPTPVLNGSHLYLDGLQVGSLVPARILSTADGVATGTFGGLRLPAFDATNMYLVLYQASGSVLDAVDKPGSPTHWSFAGDGTIEATPVTTNGIVFTGSIDGHLYGIDSNTGRQVWAATAPGAVITADGAGPITGLAAADGLLAVPAAGFLTVYTN